MDSIYWAVMQGMSGFGAAMLSRLAEHFGNGKAVWQASEQELLAADIFTKDKLMQFSELRRQRELPERLAQELESRKVELCSIKDTEYPSMLREINNPPYVLFYRGNLESLLPGIAIVGSRKASAYGKTVADMLSRGLSENKFSIISGAARGIDTAAHKGALAVHGQTVAVLGCGVDVVYPKENKPLLEAIVAEGGAVISEYLPGAQPIAGHFPARNRIISGIARGTVVVEAGLKSGSLITAEMAVQEGRDVFAVPGSIYSEGSRGCHKLLQEGAKLTTCIKDIVEEYHTFKYRKQEAVSIELSEDEKCIYDVLDEIRPLMIDEIILKTRSNVTNIAFVLLQMELKGLVIQQTPHCYVRMAKEAFR